MQNAKDVIFGQESRYKLLKGINLLSNAVRTTLGPKGRNVIIQREHSSPHVTKDGVTVAKQVILKDPLENMGAQMILEAASKTATKAGDGTTTATVLAQAIITEGMKLVSAGMNPMDLKRGIDSAVEAVVEELENISKSCDTPEEVSQVAAISANSDTKIGDKIAEALTAVGKHGAVSIESGRALEDQIEIVKGLKFDRGYISSYFSTNHEALTTVLENCYILLFDKKINDIEPLIPLLEQVSQSQKPLLVVAEDVEGVTLETLLMNNHNGTLKCCAVPAPGLDDRRLPILEDIAILTGGKVFSKELMNDLKDARIEDLGSCDRIEVDALFTTIIGGHGDENALEERIKHIRYQLDNASNDHNRNKLAERLASLDGGVAVIKVGGATEVEVNEKKDRYDDALHATRAAIDAGIVPGGGVALLRAKEKIKDLGGANIDQDAGIKIVLSAIESPIRQITSNAGGSPDVVVNKITEGKDNYGYNAANGEYGDMMKLGIIDPTKVTKTALINAASIAGLLLTTECSITITEETDDNQQQGGSVDIPFY
jgi:chaperonin GroEL